MRERDIIRKKRSEARITKAGMTRSTKWSTNDDSRVRKKIRRDTNEERIQIRKHINIELEIY